MVCASSRTRMFEKTRYGKSDAYSFDGGYIVKDGRYEIASGTKTIKGWLVIDEDGWAISTEPFEKLCDAKAFAKSL